MQPWQLRPFQPADYPAWAMICSQIQPDHVVTAADLQWQDDQFEPKHWRVRSVIEQDGQIIAVGQINHEIWRYHPQKLHMMIWVQPSQQRRGYGQALYAHLLAVSEPLAPIALRTTIREDRPTALAFAAKRGFVEEQRAWEAHLDVAAFDPTPFAAVPAQVAAQGIQIRTLAELMQSDPDCWQKLYNLDASTVADVPSSEPGTPPSYASWEQLVRYASNLIPEAYFIALDGTRYVGVSCLSTLNDTRDLEVGYTCTDGHYRGRGIAFALKLQTIAYAQAVGTPFIRTENNSTNLPMLRINNGLGFVRGLARITLIARKEDQ